MAPPIVDPPNPPFIPTVASSPSLNDSDFITIYLKCLKRYYNETYITFSLVNNLNATVTRIESQATIWIAALIALTIISSVGLLAVVIVPLLQKINYRFVLQYFVALAIGALSGDAMLHLMPHSLYAAEIAKLNCVLALGGINPGEVEENRFPLYKGVVGIGGLLIFFLSQRCFMIVGDLRKRAKQKHVRNPPAGHVHRHGKEHELDEATTVNLRSEEEEYRPLSTEMTKDDRIPNDIALISLRGVGEVREEKGGLKLESRIDQGVPIEKDDLGKKFGVTKLSSSEGESTEVKHKKHDHDVADAADAQRTPPTGKKQKHDHDEHDHDHEEGEDGHGHDHSVPTSVKSLMAMVILGDGLHNFVDGIAVGAAFAGGIAGGLSTAVAVFFHELPHELGDFAVLLKSGMSLKMALVFNLVSSVLSYIGMTIGVVIGSKDVNEWIYAVVAGMFLYVALVNMLPELTPPKNAVLWKYLVIQLLGVLTGNSIMFMIAYFEDDIKKINFGF